MKTGGKSGVGKAGLPSRGKQVVVKVRSISPQDASKLAGIAIVVGTGAKAGSGELRALEPTDRFAREVAKVIKLVAEPRPQQERHGLASNRSARLAADGLMDVVGRLGRSRPTPKAI